MWLPTVKPSKSLISLKNSCQMSLITSFVIIKKNTVGGGKEEENVAFRCLKAVLGSSNQTCFRVMYPKGNVQ